MLDHQSHVRLTTSQTEQDEAAKAGRDRAARTLLGLSRLLQQRPELRGVHPPADFAAEAIRWSA